MKEIEVIDIDDSPGCPPPTLHPRRPVRYSSDDSLPDIAFKTRRPVVRATEPVVRPYSAPGDRPRIPAERVVSVVEDDAIVFTSPVHLSKACDLAIKDIIDLNSSSDEDTLVMVPLVQRRVSHTKHTSTPPLRKTQTLPITLAQPPGASRPSVPAPLSSHILKNIDNLLTQQTKPHEHLSGVTTKKSNKRPKSLLTDGHETEDDAVAGSESSSMLKKAKLAENKLLEKQRKELERQELKRKRAEEKEAKVLAKRTAQSIAAVNHLKKSKKDCTPEMVIEVCDSLARSALHTHLGNFFEGLGCVWSSKEMPVRGLVQFRRKIVAEFDEEKDHWVPLPMPKIDVEDQLIVILKGQEFLQLSSSTDTLRQHVDSVRQVLPTANVLYLIEGLSAIMRKSQSQRNRAYQAAVRSAGIVSENPQGVTQSRSRSKAPVADIDEDAVDEALLDLQVLHGCFIVHSTSPADTAEQLSILTSDLSTVPYKSERVRSSSAFCTETGQIKTGANVRDTFERMLQSIARITPQISLAIASRYDGIRQLDTALQAGPHVLQNIPKGHNVDGSVSAQLIGLAASTKIYKALMGTDPHAEA